MGVSYVGSHFKAGRNNETRASPMRSFPERTSNVATLVDQFESDHIAGFRCCETSKRVSLRSKTNSRWGHLDPVYDFAVLPTISWTTHTSILILMVYSPTCCAILARVFHTWCLKVRWKISLRLSIAAAVHVLDFGFQKEISHLKNPFGNDLSGGCEKEFLIVLRYAVEESNTP